MRFGYLCNFGITSSPTHHYQYDDVGNRTSVLDLGVTKSYGANSVNAYTSISGFAAPAHDANGNMNSGPLGVVGAATSALTYGKENNNLLSASGTQATNFVYDAMGRLGQFSYTENSVTKTEILSWAGWTLMSREIFTGNAVSESHRYTWGTDLSGTMEGAGGVGGLLAVERNVAGSNIWDIRYTHVDANGNIIALTNSSGNVSARYRYDAFGKVLSATDVDNTGWVNHNIHGFSSKPSFGNQGLLYYGYRWYSPSLGRWINRDPFEESGGMNLYGFVGNDGVNIADYLGLASVQITTTCEASFDKKNPTADEINQFLSSLPACCKIKTFEVNGHGTSTSIEISMNSHIETHAIHNADNTITVDDIQWDSESGSFIEDVKDYVDSDTVIRFDGCHTGCEGPIFGDDNNLATETSKKLPAKVSGFKGVGLGNAARIPFTEIGDNNPTASIGDRRYYVNGRWYWGFVW